MEMSLHVIMRVDLLMRHRIGLSTMIPFPTATELLQKQVNSMNQMKDMGSVIAPPYTVHPSPDTGALSVSAIHPVMNQGFCAHWCVRCILVVFLGSLWCLYWYSANGYADASSDITVNIVSSQDGPLFQSWEYGRSYENEHSSSSLSDNKCTYCHAFYRVASPFRLFFYHRWNTYMTPKEKEAYVNNTIYTPDKRLYRGTYDYPRFRANDSGMIVYPRRGARVVFHPSSPREKAKAVGGIPFLLRWKRSFLRQYRNHVLLEQFQYPSNSTFLFIVNYHFSKYGSYSFLEKEYFPRFAALFPFDFDLVYIGPTYSPFHRIFQNTYSTHGKYSYHSFRVAIDLFPRSEGFVYRSYVFMNDDSFVDPLFLSTYDLDRSWGEGGTPLRCDAPDDWHTELNLRGIPFAQAYMEALDELSGDPTINDRCHMDHPFHHVKGWGDFFIVSKGDLDLFLRMEEVMIKHQVFLEYAVANIISCFNPEILIDCNHMYMERRTRCVHIHPVKYSQEAMREYGLKRLQHKNMYEVPISDY